MKNVYTKSIYKVAWSHSGNKVSDSWFHNDTLSPKFKRVSLDETPEFPFWGLHLDFDLRDSKKNEKIKKLNKITFHNKNIDIHKTA